MVIEAEKLYDQFKAQANELELALLLQEEKHFELEQRRVDKSSMMFVSSAELLELYKTELDEARSKEFYYESLLKTQGHKL